MSFDHKYLLKSVALLDAFNMTVNNDKDMSHPNLKFHSQELNKMYLHWVKPMFTAYSLSNINVMNHVFRCIGAWTGPRCEFIDCKYVIIA